jgi:hypothetical protein
MTEPHIDTAALLEFAKKTHLRPDWHEPDEAGVRAVIHGGHLDNACGNSVRHRHTDYQEFVIELRNDDDDEPLRINLASLLAEVCRLARKEV